MCLRDSSATQTRWTRTAVWKWQPGTNPSLMRKIDVCLSQREQLVGVLEPPVELVPCGLLSSEVKCRKAKSYKFPWLLFKECGWAFEFASSKQKGKSSIPDCFFELKSETDSFLPSTYSNCIVLKGALYLTCFSFSIQSYKEVDLLNRIVFSQAQSSIFFTISVYCWC